MRIVWDRAASRECVTQADALAAPAARGDADAHLAACAPCRGVAAALATVQRASAGDGADLWPRLRARLAAGEQAAIVSLRFPHFGWEAVAALVTAVTTASLVPEPGRLLAVLIGMV